MKKFLKITAAALILSALLTGCASIERSGVSVPTVSVSPQSVTGSETHEPVSYSSGANSSETSDESSEPPIVYDPDQRFVIFDKYAKTAPYPDAERSRFYASGMLVRVASEEPTETGYFELNNGDFIRAECLAKPDERDNFYYQRVSGGLPPIGEPPEETPEAPPYDQNGEPIVYDRSAALQYAREHWDIDECFCAEFASECLTAGGLKYDLASSTALYNELIGSGLGYAVAVDLNEDGFAELPRYVKRGDLVFYYCPAENLMVHTTIYNGESEDGFMAAFSHNPRSNGEDNCTYYKNCPGGCGCPLTTVVAFCFTIDD
ncbi:MAG: amidase domain-containing protein [Oscillospiraceae bacterium]|nr:amidase domain-containing protein [Oscillospiraceae bacterium]